MKKKHFLAILFIAAIVIMNIQVVSAAGTCEFIGEDRESGGDWIDKYGEDGYIVFANEINDQLPAYAKIDPLNEYKDAESSLYVWWDESDGNEPDDATLERIPRALYVDKAKTYRAAACHYNNDSPEHYLVVDVGSETKYVTIYSLDWDENGRESEITVLDENDNVLINTMDLINFESGVYLKFKVSGKVTFEYNKKEDTPGNAVYGGIFFDPMEVVEEAAPEVVEASETAAAPVAEAPADAPQAVVDAPVAVPATGDGIAVVLVLLAMAGAVVALVGKKSRNRA